MNLIAILTALIGYVCSNKVPVLGCLSYKNGQCISCDRNNWYFLVGTTCQIMSIENCHLSINGQSCSICFKGYYPEIDTGACVLVSQEIQNCLIYADASTCETCEKGYYPDASGCAKASVVIPNCSIYDGTAACKKCEKGFIKTPGIVLPLNDGFITTANFCQNHITPNCQSGSMLRCVQCNSGYMYFANNYLNTIKGFTRMSFRRLFTESIFTSLNHNPYFSVCARANVPNCLVHDQFYFCASCATGYFVDPNGLCQQIPDPIIQNCFEYRTSGVCRLCLSGFYISADYTCNPHTVTISNCGTMSPTVLNMCAQCATGYFLSSNSCILRNVQIANCATYAASAENCVACAPTYLLSSDKTTCYTAIVNCYEYIFLQNSVTCRFCNPGMYFDNAQGCIKVPNSISGCQFYSPVALPNPQGSSYTCAICQKFHLITSEGACNAFSVFLGRQITCESTDQSQVNICNGCFEKQVLTNVINYCDPVPPVSLDQNCKAYNTTGWCIECFTGFFLNNGNCFRITIANCITVSTSNALQCTKCQSVGLSSFFVSTTEIPNTCISTYDHVTTNCVVQDGVVTNSISKTNTNVCTECYSPYYPDTFLVAQFCVPLPKLRENFGVQGSLPSSVNCQVWSVTLKACLFCQFNLRENYNFLVSKSTCVSSCPPGQNIKTVQGPYFFFCNTTGPLLQNCGREDGTACAQCAFGYLPLVVEAGAGASSISGRYAYIPMNSTRSFKSQMLSFNSTWNRVYLFSGCQQITPTLGMMQSSTTNVGTFYPVIVSQSDYSPSSSIFNYCRGVFTRIIGIDHYLGCLACTFGYTGYYVFESTNTVNFISNCFINTECDYSTFYNGLGSQLQNGILDFFVGCHKCVNAATTVTFSRYGRVGNVASGMPSSATSFLPQTSCFKNGMLNVNSFFPVDCAVQEIIHNINVAAYPSTGALTNVNPICWACKPGFRASFDAPTSYVAQCTLITNCDSILGMDTFNKCTRCSSGFALNTLMDTCEKTTIANCYILDTSVADRTCTQCNAGYVVSRDKLYCNGVNINNCQSFNLFSLNAEHPNTAYLGYGCTHCAIGYIAVSFDLPQSLCILNPRFQDAALMPIPNCFYFSSLTTCSKCAIGYVLPIGVTDKCVAVSLIPNCDLYNPDRSCNTCQRRFILQNSACVDGALYNTNCDYFTNQTVCATCSAGFTPIQTSPGIVRCFQATIGIPRCLIFNTTLSLTNVLSCIICEISYYPKTPSPVIPNFKGCVGIPTTDNCAAYNMANFQCTQCNPEYYLQQTSAFSGNLISSCIRRRTNQGPSCASLDPTSDSCAVCIDGYYARNNICEPKPKGIVNCGVYQDLSTCLRCANGTYLSANLCQPVPTANFIPNCQFYRGPTTCEACLPGYFLSKNQCLLISVSNCQVYQSATVCQQCASGFFITADGSCQKPFILNCLVFASLNACQQCATNYYVNSNGACSAVPAANLILNCLYYTPNLACSQCTHGTILSKTGNACLFFKSFPASAPESLEEDQFCDGFIYQDNCNVCEGAHLFSNGDCVPCNVNLPNCELCDFSNKTNCLACQSGFSMTEDGLCKNNTVSISVIQIDTTTTFFPYTPDTSFIPTWGMGTDLMAVNIVLFALTHIAFIENY